MFIHRAGLALAFGFMGNIISFITFLAPLPTFYKIYRKKSAEGFQAIPYLVSLLSAMLLIYYGLLKEDTFLITINAIGCFIEAAYAAAYLLYASKISRVQTLKLLVGMNVLGYGVVLLVTMLMGPDKVKRAYILGWVCMAFSLSVFAAPLCIMRKVIKTKSVEYMPFSLSLFLTVGAVVWFFYGFLKSDYFIAVPNVLGFIFGLVQMLLYYMYSGSSSSIEKKSKPEVPVAEPATAKLHELTTDHIIDVVKLTAIMCPEIDPVPVLKDVTNNGGIEVVVTNVVNQEDHHSPEIIADQVLAKETEISRGSTNN